ncbi:MAG: YlcI/YnfO family protein [Gemmatimonadaceae bacterium]
MERTTVRLPDELFEQAKAHARRSGRTFTQFLEQAVRAELAQHSAAGRVAERAPVYAVQANERAGNAATEQPVPTATQRERSANQLLEQVQELQAFLSALPDRDLRSPDEILGYNATGLPE